MAIMHRPRLVFMDEPTVGAAQPAQDRDERGLAGPVSSEQSEYLPGFDAQVDPAQDLVSAVALVDSPGVQARSVWV